MGKIETSHFDAGGDVLERKLYEIFAENVEITGIAKAVDLEVLSVKETTFGGRQIVFEQVVNGLTLERRSSLHVSSEGNVDRLNLYVADPSHMDFSNTSWIKHNLLEDMARTAWLSQFGSSAGRNAETRYLIVYEEASTTFRPALELRNSSRFVTLDAITGNTLLASRNTFHLSE